MEIGCSPRRNLTSLNFSVSFPIALMVDDAPIKGHVNTSTVNHKKPVHGKECLAYRTNKDNIVVDLETFKAMTKPEKKAQDFGHCGDCRACWSRDVANISYPLH